MANLILEDNYSVESGDFGLQVATFWLTFFNTTNDGVKCAMVARLIKTIKE